MKFSVRSVMSAGGVYALLALAFVVLDGSNDVERSIYDAQHSDIAMWALHGVPLDVPTYPIWGYGLFRAVTGTSDIVLLVAQVILCWAAWLAWHQVSTTLVPDRPRLHKAVLLTASIPWFALSVTRQPMPVAAALVVLGLCAWQQSLCRERGWVWASIAILALGLAPHFRFEWVAFLVALPVLAHFGHRSWRKTVKTCLIVGVAICMLAPWHVFAKRTTGEWHARPSNGGMVLYLSLGQLPNNPWGIVAEDGFVIKQAEEEGVGPAWSPVADRVFRDRAVNAVMAHPVSFAGKLGRNALGGAFGGLYVGRGAPIWLSTQTVREGRSRLKDALIDRSVAGVVAEPASVAATVWEYGARLGLGVPFMLMASLGLVGLLRRRLSALVVVCAGFWGLQLLLVSVFLYQPRHMTQVVPFMAPFAVRGLAYVWDWATAGEGLGRLQRLWSGAVGRRA